MGKTLTVVLTTLLLLVGATQESKAQNIQVQYDTERDCVTSTLEMFRPDAFGSTFFFVDMDYTPNMTGDIGRFHVNYVSGKTVSTPGCRYI